MNFESVDAKVWGDLCVWQARPVVHRAPKPSPKWKNLALILGYMATNPGLQREMAMSLFLLIHGKRNCVKSPVKVAELRPGERRVYRKIMAKFNRYPLVRERVHRFLGNRGISKRLLNYFIVHYVKSTNLVYYLDTTTYPYKVFLDEPGVPRVGVHCIDLGLEYRLAKQHVGPNELHCPYARSVRVEGHEYSLSELSFTLWLDSVGAIDIFYVLEPVIRASKRKRAATTEVQVCGKRRSRAGLPRVVCTNHARPFWPGGESQVPLPDPVPGGR